MIELNQIDFERVRPLFRRMDIHLTLQAILAGNVKASILVDNPRQPQMAITWTGHRFYLLGRPSNTDLISTARKIFLEQFTMQAWKSGIDSYLIYYPSENWEGFIRAMLQQKYPIMAQRSYYAGKVHQHADLVIPENFVLRPVDVDLLSEKWQNLEMLTDEMTSERESVQDFLSKSFGVCLTKGNLIVGWCLSEYNTVHRCEIGIATLEDYQKKGLATLMTEAFIEVARARNVARIGWHCQATNYASGATAISAGFEKVQDYPVFIGWFDDALNLAQNGFFAHKREDYAGALVYYEKSFAMGEVPDWAYWGAACDAAMVDEKEKALNYLSTAIELGYNDLEQISKSKFLESLHDTARWNDILNKLES